MISGVEYLQDANQQGEDRPLIRPRGGRMQAVQPRISGAVAEAEVRFAKRVNLLMPESMCLFQSVDHFVNFSYMCRGVMDPPGQ